MKKVKLFLSYFGKTFLGMTIWQALGALASLLATNLPPVAILLYMVFMLIILVIPSLIIAAVFYLTDQSTSVDTKDFMATAEKAFKKHKDAMDKLK